MLQTVYEGVLDETASSALCLFAMACSDLRSTDPMKTNVHNDLDRDGNIIGVAPNLMLDIQKMIERPRTALC
jgi:hypothetical protein